jgi:glycerol kinase
MNKMAKYAAAVDQGTTSTRFMIFDHKGQVVGIAQKEHEQIYPKPGWVEHDPMEIWTRTQEVIKGALQASGVSPKDIAAVGVTNQRETRLFGKKRPENQFITRLCGKIPARIRSATN